MRAATSHAAGVRRPIRPLGGWLVFVLEILLAVGALAGGVSLATGAIDASSFSSDLPFESPVLAGIALVAVNAVVPAVVVVAAVRQASSAMNGHRIVGAALMGWIVVQIGFIGLSSWLQPVLFLWGAAIVGLSTVVARPRTVS